MIIVISQFLLKETKISWRISKNWPFILFSKFDTKFNSDNLTSWLMRKKADICLGDFNPDALIKCPIKTETKKLQVTSFYMYPSGWRSN